MVKSVSSVHEFFNRFQPRTVNSTNFDELIIDDQRIKIIFLWGINCPNCEVAKNVLAEYAAEAKRWNLDWYHANIYEDFELANRFGLHGIPVFLVYRGSKKLGKISPFPGWSAFSEAIEKVLNTN